VDAIEIAVADIVLAAVKVFNDNLQP